MRRQSTQHKDSTVSELQISPTTSTAFQQGPWFIFALRAGEGKLPHLGSGIRSEVISIKLQESFRDGYGFAFIVPLGSA